MKVLSSPTMPVLPIENHSYSNNSALVHLATQVLLEQHLRSLDLTDTVMLDYADSKPEALRLFLEAGYRYTIASEEVFFASAACNGIDIIERFCPEMIWCLYRVVGC